ncbi:Uncharacterised protein [Candidatus Bilamarchaeum dharawalense]|uniref:Uncharacterized protein n=1 Tax=Candidatus Bilamarchaeum dharawalense TaxID=2885759 RepID=A0A5E4LTA8_9ARCH|nr:Uncharacterised protein [Candidatus Bilamarchaeum dharawalense]
MKSTEEKLDDDGFEEIESKPESSGQQSGGGNRPDFRIVQTDRDKDGNVVYSNIGGMWKNISKNGKTFYTMRIGQLKLLVFPNERK